ncbi:MAG: energy-coupling factor transporter ATPase [Clostridiales bacterium]|nr:energy-coupling factor transporter ATPase [Clostridiales bacterium]
MSLLEVKNLTYSYGVGTPFEKKALDNVSVNINAGEFIGVIGHTGSGKSTLMQMLNGLLKPERGQVFLNGNDINAPKNNIRNIRFKVGLVFQYPEHQLFDDTVRKDISFGPRNMGLSEEEIDERVISAAEFVGLKRELLDKSPFELSGGEKRRAAIAGVISMEPDIIIFDEPTAGLDPNGRNYLLERINDYHKTKGKTVILVSHSMEDIAKYAQKVLVLNKGRIEMFDETKIVFSQVEKLDSMGLRVPQITYIMNKLKEYGYDVSGGVLTVEEAYKELNRLLCRKRGEKC